MREWARIPNIKRIALDATYSIGRNLSGVGVYSRQILFGLAEAHPEERFAFAYRPHRLLRSLRDELPRNAARVLLAGSGIVPGRCRLFHALNQRVDRRFAPTVCTFHDLFVLTNEYSTAEFRTRFAAQARTAASSSDLIVAVSEFTARQVCDLLGVERRRVRVIHHGVRPPASAPVTDRDRENLVLHVGAIQVRKNIARLVAAFEGLPEGWRLVLAGGAGYGAAEIMERIARSPRARDIEVAGYVGDAELESYYRRARIFAFPSLDEGFGMPVLDAMSRGVPVLTSNRSALPEVAGGAAVLVDPADSDAVVFGLRKLADDAGLRERLYEAGLKRAARFSWSEAVDATWTVYRELAG